MISSRDIRRGNAAAARWLRAGCGTQRREKITKRGERNRSGAIAPASAEASAIRLRQQHEDPRQYLRDAGGVFSFTGGKWQRTIIAAKGRMIEEEKMPISALLARIRRLLPGSGNEHYDEIVRNFGVGTLRPPPTPMSDGELARAIAEFLKETPSSSSVATLGRRIDPSSPL
ncbi:hypothetical protein ACVW0I_004107 [Bradyrhizobium sp. LM6.11]